MLKTLRDCLNIEKSLETLNAAAENFLAVRQKKTEKRS